MAEQPDMALASRLPMLPGSIWSVLAKLSWSNPDLVRAHHIPIEAELQGTVGQDGTAVEGDGKVVAKRYFLVRRITGYVEVDPVAAADETRNAFYTTWKLEDQERQFPVMRENQRMEDLAGVGASPRPSPIDYDDAPLVFLPEAKIIATFVPLNGFATAAHTITALTTRIAGVTLYGMLVAQDIVDRLLDMNDAALREAGLIGKRSKE